MASVLDWAVQVLVYSLILAMFAALLLVVVLYFVDTRQTQSTIRRNYPVIGRFRYWFEHLGEFFRQYFFAMDREEMPFNRAMRAWVYRAAKGLSTYTAFGSTRNNLVVGEPHFVNAAYPVLDSEIHDAKLIEFGPYCETPYKTRSFFNISGMSFGALSVPAVTSLSKGAALAGCWLNTGEGGLSPHHLAGNADIVFQMGTAKYGVRDSDGNLSESKLAVLAANPQVKMIEIKLSQGAKPGKGGILPADKVTAEIAAIRGIPAGHPSNSPNRHTDVNNDEELLNLINRVRSVSGKPVGIKVVLGGRDWLSGFCESILQRGIESAPDFITLDSADGGTGAAPQSLMDFMGLPLRESLPLLVDELLAKGLRERIKVIASGKLITPGYVAQALATGADVVVTARGFMFALGCIQAMQCNKNTCPTGITTHDKRLQKGLDPTNKAARVASYHAQMVHDIEVIAHSCGLAEPSQLRREHVRIVQANGRSIPLLEL